MSLIGAHEQRRQKAHPGFEQSCCSFRLTNNLRHWLMDHRRSNLQQAGTYGSSRGRGSISKVFRHLQHPQKIDFEENMQLRGGQDQPLPSQQLLMINDQLSW
jgi:hypothetical protein